MAEDKDTRYFLTIDRATLEILSCGFDQKQNLDKGRQPNETEHRLFITKGQYNKFVDRCGDALKSTS